MKKIQTILAIDTVRDKLTAILVRPVSAVIVAVAVQADVNTLPISALKLCVCALCCYTM